MFFRRASHDASLLASSFIAVRRRRGSLQLGMGGGVDVRPACPLDRRGHVTEGTDTPTDQDDDIIGEQRDV